VVQPLSWLSIYTNYTKSFGVTNALQVPGQPIFPPEQGVQYEAGVKAELLDKRLTATFAVYDIVKTNVVQALGGTPFSTPVGRVESKGVELDVNGRINENWSVIASYSYDDARVINGQGPNAYAVDNGIFISSCSNNPYCVSENGNRLQDVPLNAGALWLKYSASGPWSGLSVGGGVIAVGERAGDNQNDYALPGYARIDGMIQYRWIPPADTGMKAVTFQLNVKNLANAVYFQNSSSRLDAFPGAPRTFLVSLRAEF
jgi:iron complex outermembrane recepter protein